ncbi:MAG: siroheme synthase [Hyphomicrobiales bacterium]
MRYLPISLKTLNATILLVGNGEAALNKLRLLMKTHAQIQLFALSPSLELATFLIQNPTSKLTHLHRNFTETDLKNAVAIFSCEDDAAENQKIANLALKANIPFNSPDNSDICTFFVPSIVDRSPVTIAISTEGTAPVLAKQIRAHLEHYLPQNTGKLANFAQSIRSKVQSKLNNMGDKRHFWENFFNGNIASHFLKGDLAKSHVEIDKSLKNPTSHNGKLYIIHAADPDLLSIKAARMLQLADYIYQIQGTDVDIEQFTNLSRRDAQFVSVSTNPNKPQDGELIMQISNQIRCGHIVVVIGDDSTNKRKTRIFNHLVGKDIAIEQLNSAQLNVERPNQFSQTQF